MHGGGCLFESKMRSVIIFFFNDTATTEIYTLSLHDALPIFSDLAQKIGHNFCSGGPIFTNRTFL